MNSHKGFVTAAEASEYIFGGKATFTVKSDRTGEHFTYKVVASEGNGIRFVSVLNGPDNRINYKYIGFIPTGAKSIYAGKKGLPYAPSYKALDWVLRNLGRDVLPPDLTIYHEGRCCRCGRKLTHPDSVAVGIGPECIKMRG